MYQIFSIQPDRLLVFTLNVQTNKFHSQLQLQNISNQYGAFKIRINNALAYHVTPTIGVLKPGSKINIEIVLTNEINLSQDKFQILGGMINQEDDVVNYFKKQKNIEMVILRCSKVGDIEIPYLITSSIQSTQSAIQPIQRSEISTRNDSEILSQIKNIVIHLYIL